MKLTWLVLCCIGGASGQAILGVQPARKIIDLIPRQLCAFFPSASYCKPRRPPPPKQNFVGRPYIDITVSPLVTSKSIRVLDISWNCGDQCRSGDWVALYRKPPENKGQPSLFKDIVSTGRGWVRTGVQEMRMLPRKAYFHSKCLGYWAAYWSPVQEEPLTTTCLMTNPTWMEDIWEDIKHLKLNEVFLPGSHDAGSYTLHDKPYSQKKYNKYIYNQDETILEQLIHGSRHLDLRIGFFGYKGYWVNHQIIRTQPLQVVLADILLFLDKTREILIVDLHGFPFGFRGSPAAHEAFMVYLTLYLGEHMAPFTGYDTTLEEIRNSRKRLIVAYNNAKIACRHPSHYWRPVSQRWGNVNNIEDLKFFLAQEMESDHGNGMWASMAELTAGTVNLLMDRLGGLRVMADTCNHNVTDWFKNEWGMSANVVAVDFIRSSGIVSAAIMWNVVKGSMRSFVPNLTKSPKSDRRKYTLEAEMISTQDRASSSEEYEICVEQVKSERSKQPHPWWDLNVSRNIASKFLNFNPYYPIDKWENHFNIYPE